MDAHPNWKVPLRLIEVKSSLASYHGETLEIHTQSFPKVLDNYCIISYVWSHGDNFAVDQICGVTRTRRTITSCSLPSFVGMLDICDQMGMKHVWIDCVCVEQENIELKSLQLAEMGYYYSHASRCLVFVNGLNMYTPPIFEGGNIGSWYDRVWTVQEAVFTSSKKTFVHALPRVTLLESSDIITSLRIRAEHVDLISRCLTRNKYFGGDHEVYKVEDISEWFLGLVHEENYRDFWSLTPKLSSEVSFCRCHWQTGIRQLQMINLALDLKHNEVSHTIREALRGTRGCRYPQDRVYSILTLLDIQLDVSYSRSLRDTMCKAAEAMSPEMLVHFITATWYSQDGHALPEITGHGCDGLKVVMGISNCIADLKVEGLNLLITTKAKLVNISRLGDTGFNSSQSHALGWYRSHAHPFLLNGDAKARGEVNLTGDEEVQERYPDPASVFGSPALDATLLFMGKSSLKGFEIASNGRLERSTDEVPANVCLVVRYVNATWIKVGVLYVSEDLIFEPESAQFVLKL